MAVESGVFGTDLIIKNLNKEIRGIEGRTEVGLRSASLFVKGEAQKRTPVDTGNLRASAYVSALGKLRHIVGYTAFYAPFVHEIDKNYRFKRTRLTRTGNKVSESIFTKSSSVGTFMEVFSGVLQQGPTKGWKFLERALQENHRRIIQIIANKAKIK